jgi:hypothetical protein
MASMTHGGWTSSHLWLSRTYGWPLVYEATPSARDKDTTARTLDLMLGPIESAMGAKLPESGRESTSMCHSISRVMLFYLNGVTHDGKSRRNSWNSALRCGFVSRSICFFPFDNTMIFPVHAPEHVTRRRPYSGIGESGQTPEGAKPVQWQGPWR